MASSQNETGAAPGVYIYNPAGQQAQSAPTVSNTQQYPGSPSTRISQNQNPLHFGLSPHRRCYPFCYKRWWGNLIKQHRYKVAMQHRVRYVRNEASCPECYILRVPDSSDLDHCVCIVFSFVKENIFLSA